MQDGVNCPHARAPIGIERDLSTAGRVLLHEAVAWFQRTRVECPACQGDHPRDERPAAPPLDANLRSMGTPVPRGPAARDTIDPGTRIMPAQRSLRGRLTQLRG